MDEKVALEMMIAKGWLTRATGGYCELELMGNSSWGEPTASQARRTTKAKTKAKVEDRDNKSIEAALSHSFNSAQPSVTQGDWILQMS